MIKSYPKTKHVKLRGAAYRRFAEQVMERDNWQCVECGTTQNLTVAHVIHKKAGGGNGPGDVLENVRCLCIRCHDEEERHLNGKRKR